MLQTTQVLQERYQLQKQLGNNAGRQTWLATDITTSPPESVTVKLLAFSPQMQWEEFKLFEREASVLKQLNHPRIPKYRDYFSLDKQTGAGLCWFGLVQDYIPGYSLQELLDQGKRFTETQIRSIATQVLEILTYLHGLNPPVLHRDIKPSNLILGEDKKVYLVDFGAVQDSAAAEGVTFTVVGTTGYAPLEQFWGKTVPASDLYALGATLIHLLTGLPPADLPQSNLRIQFKEKVSINSAFFSWIEALVEPDLDLRLSSANQAIEALQTGRLITYNLQTINPPYGSKIKIKRHPDNLIIKIPRTKSLLDKNFAIWLMKMILTLTLGTSLLGLFLLIAITGTCFLIGIVSSLDFNPVNTIFCLLFFVPVIYVLWKLYNFGKKEYTKMSHDLSAKYFPVMGNCWVEFNKTKFIIRYDCLHIRYLRQVGRISNNLKVVSSNNFKNVFLVSQKRRYYLGSTSTQAECKWLMQEIEEWLAQR